MSIRYINQTIISKKIVIMNFSGNHENFNLGSFVKFSWWKMSTKHLKTSQIRIITAGPFKILNPDSIEVKWFYTKNWKWISERKKPVLNFDIGGVRVMVAIGSCVFSRPFLGGVGASSRSEFSKKPRQTYAIIKYTGSLQVFKKSPANRKNIVNKYVFKSGFLAEGWNFSIFEFKNFNLYVNFCKLRGL